MKKLLYVAFAIFSFAFTTKNVSLEVPAQEEFEVIVSLVGRSGNKVSTNTLSGYYAYNIETNQYYYDDYYYGESGVISNLPAGSYRIGAYDGYFDGASSEFITITEGSDETVEVTLQYWVE